MIKDSSKNFYYVDVATTEQSDITTVTKDYYIDGVKLLNGHRVLIKDQKLSIVLLNTADPNTYFTGNYTVVQDSGATIEYQYYSEENGVYLNADLIKTDDEFLVFVDKLKTYYDKFKSDFWSHIIHNRGCNNCYTIGF